MLYWDEAGHQITLAYRRGSETASLQISSTLGGTLEARPVTVDGVSADLYLEETQEEGNALVWARDGLLFWMIAPCSQEELTAMAESVEVLPVEYKLTWVPEGYELYLQNDTFGHTFTFLYKNPEGNMMCFLYQPDKEKARMYLVPNEDSTEKQVSVKGDPGDLYRRRSREAPKVSWSGGTRRWKRFAPSAHPCLRRTFSKWRRASRGQRLLQKSGSPTGFLWGIAVREALPVPAPRNTSMKTKTAMKSNLRSWVLQRRRRKKNSRRP